MLKLYTYLNLPCSRQIPAVKGNGYSFKKTVLTSLLCFWVSAKMSSGRSAFSLSKPLIGEDGKIYACSEKTLFAFESNGSIAWSLDLDFKCNIGMAPVHGGKGKIYLVAEDTVFKVDFMKMGPSESATQVFFGGGPGKEGASEIIGLAVSTLSSAVFINVKNRGLFAFMTHGEVLWSAGPVQYQSDYHQGCRKTVTDCYFTSYPVIDQCEANVYISNTQGELYSFSVRSPRFNWIQDFSSFDKVLTITSGNNGRLYVTVPVKALVFALDASSGYVLWQRSIGPLSTADYAPVVDSNGWISVGSLDGFLYSFSPTGSLHKFSKSDTMDSVIQVSPLLDCSGYAVYISQTKMSGKFIHTIDEYTYVSTMKPESVVFSLMVPATGSIHWSETYPGEFSSLLSKSDLQHFDLDESLVLAFVTAAKTGNTLQCRTTRQKIAASCSQTKPKRPGIYTGNERAILLFLFFESVVLLVLAVLVRFCCTFWRKKEAARTKLGNVSGKASKLFSFTSFLVYQFSFIGNVSAFQRSLQLKKKAFDRTITELEQKAAEEAVSGEVIEKLSSLVQERKGVERKLSTTYSLGRDTAGSGSKSLLPVYDAKTRSYSFQGPKKESVTIFHTLSTDTSSGSTETENSWDSEEDKDGSAANTKAKAKAKAPIEADSSSDDGVMMRCRRSPSEPASSSRGFISPLFVEQEGEAVESMSMSSSVLKRRRTLSSTK
ncbi:hypothetical protein Pint_18837 [Pistacia integerrima]|uniref:Uncharacterized protein n=1 Tax=Pistacia integerrima TaxID=434235 RepID=A0ACC0Z1P4_9ROSI|nr:hypothetical protein Pint_18837 [Pistacia integerrima]